MSTKQFFIACLLAVCVRADESACDCSSETSKVETLSSQVKKLEGELEGSISSTKTVEQQLGALKSSSQTNEANLQKKMKEMEASQSSSENALQQKVKELETSKTNSQKAEAELQKKVKELEASQSSSENALQKKVKELETSKTNSQMAEADLQKKVKELEGSHASSGKETEKQMKALKTTSQETEAALREQIRELSEQLKDAKKSGEISMMGFASTVGSMTNGVVKHALDHTDLDEQLSTKVGTHVNTARGAAGKMASNLKDRITSVKYADVLERVSSSETYQKVTDKVAEKTQSLRPHIDKARVHLEPALAKAKDLAGPAWTKAQPTLEMAKTKALETYVASAAAVQTHVLPVLKRGGSSALDQVSEAALAQLQKVMTPTFAAIQQAVPEHSESLPKHPIDQALFLLAGVVLAYYSLYFVRVALRITLRLTTRTSWMSVKLFKLIVMIPLRIVLYLIDLMWWVATLFYCCGLCRKKKKAAKLATKAKKEEKKTGETTAKASETVTAAECQALFETSKKQNKVAEAAQALAKNVKNKKPMKATSVQGKILTKEVFLQTCKKFNVDIKKLDL